MNYYLFEIPQQNEKFVLLPFLFCAQQHGEINQRVSVSPDQLEALCKWVQPHLEATINLIKIKEVYNELICYIDNEIMKPSPYWDNWKKAREIH